MRDIHEFFPLLKRFRAQPARSPRCHRERSFVRRLDLSATRNLLERASADAVPIMCFVGNRGGIQIHHGPVSTIKIMGPWLNVLDPGFNLHLRQDLVAETWLVRKPTRHGLITSVELYAEDRSLIAQFFGVREEQSPGRPRPGGSSPKPCETAKPFQKRCGEYGFMSISPGLPSIRSATWRAVTAACVNP